MTPRKWLRHQTIDEQIVTLAARRAAKRARNLKANKIYAQRHPDRVIARAKRWRARNAEHIRERNKIWKKENPEKYAASMKLWRAVPKNRMRSIIRSRIADAKRRGITVDEVAMWEFVKNPPTHCAISGIVLDYSVDRGRNIGHSPSIDRIKPSLGYIRGNIAVVSHRINTIKSFGTADEHRLIADYLDQLK